MKFDLTIKYYPEKREAERVFNIKDRDISDYAYVGYNTKELPIPYRDSMTSMYDPNDEDSSAVYVKNEDGSITIFKIMKSIPKDQYMNFDFIEKDIEEDIDYGYKIWECLHDYIMKVYSTDKDAYLILVEDEPDYGVIERSAILIRKDGTIIANMTQIEEKVFICTRKYSFSNDNKLAYDIIDMMSDMIDKYDGVIE